MPDEEPATSLERGFRIGAWNVDPAGNRLWRDGESYQIGSKAMDLLVLLAAHPGETVPKDTIFATVWNDTFVGDNALWKCIFELRQVLEEDSGNPKLIFTVPRRGYRLEASAVSSLQAPPLASSRRFWLTLVVIAAGLIVVVLAALLFSWWSPSPPVAGQRPTVLVARLDNRTGDPLLDGTLDVVLESRLNDSGRLQLVSRPRIEDALGLMRERLDAPLTEELARRVSLRDGGVDLLVSGQLDSLGSRYHLTLRMLDARSHDVIASDVRQTRTRENLFALVDRQVTWLLNELGISESGEIGRPERVTTDSLEALGLYARGVERYRTRSSPSETRKARAERKAQAAVLFQEAIQVDPDFASSYLMLAWSLLQADSDDPRRVAPGDVLKRAQGGGRDLVISRDTWTAVEKAMELREQASLVERAFIQGCYYGWKGEHRVAVPYYRLAVQLQPEHHWAAANLMWSAIALNDAALYAEAGLALSRGRPGNLGMQMNALVAAQTAGELDNVGEIRKRVGAIVSNRWPDGAGPESPLHEVTPWLWEFDIWLQWRQGDYSGAQAALVPLSQQIAGLEMEGVDIREHAYALAALHLMLGQEERANQLDQHYGLLRDGRRTASPSAVRAFLKESPEPLGSSDPQNWRSPSLRPVARLAFDENFAAGYEILNSPRLNPKASELISVLLRTDPVEKVTGLKEWIDGLPPHFTRPEVRFGVRWILADVLRELRREEEAVAIWEGMVSDRDRTSAGAVVIWQKAALELARAYLRRGRQGESEALLSKLADMLEFADDDHPILRELDALVGRVSVDGFRVTP